MTDLISDPITDKLQLLVLRYLAMGAWSVLPEATFASDASRRAVTRCASALVSAGLVEAKTAKEVNPMVAYRGQVWLITLEGRKRMVRSLRALKLDPVQSLEGSQDDFRAKLAAALVVAASS